MPETSQSVTKTRAAVLSIVSNSVLIAIKLTAGLITGSVAILSDGVHSLMDLVASLITFTSVRKGAQPADRSHRFGHGKFEDLAALGQAALLLLGAAFIVSEAIDHLVAGEALTSPYAGIVVSAIAAIVNLVVSRRLARTAHTVGSAALEANAMDLRTDVAVSLGVLVSLVGFAVTGARWLDPAVALAVALVIAVTGIRILIGAGRRLTDEALPTDELAILERVTRSFIGSEIVDFHDIRARHVGNHHEVDLHLQFAHGTSLERAHALAHRVQDAIVAELPGTSVLVHMEPEDRVRPDRFEHQRREEGSSDLEATSPARRRGNLRLD